MSKSTLDIVDTQLLEDLRMLAPKIHYVFTTYVFFFTSTTGQVFLLVKKFVHKLCKTKVNRNFNTPCVLKLYNFFNLWS